MKSYEYLNLLIEGKLIATPSVEKELVYFTGIPNDLLDIVRELDIKYGVRSDKAIEIVGEMVHQLGFIKTIAGAPHANYEDLRIATNSDIRKFAEFIYNSPSYFNGGESPSKNEIENIIRKHLPGKFKQQTNLFDEAKEKEAILYHATLAKNVPSILKKGIVPKKKGITSGMFGQDIRAAVAVFAFTDRLGALKWAHKVEFDTKEKAAIIPFKAILKDWTPDTHWQARTGVYKLSPVPPEKIIEDKIEYPTADTWRWLVKELDKEYK